MQEEVKWLRAFSGNILPKGAGTRPVNEIDPLAMEAMREVGVDISNQRSKMLTEDMIRNLPSG